MRTRFFGIAGLTLSLVILGGAAASSAHGGSAIPLSYSGSHEVGAGLSAPLFQLLNSNADNSSQDPACATQDQDQSGANETNEVNASDTDSVDLQCGDQGNAGDQGNVDNGNAGDQGNAANGNAGGQGNVDNGNAGDQGNAGSQGDSQNGDSGNQTNAQN